MGKQLEITGNENYAILNNEGVVMAKGFETLEAANKWKETKFNGYYSKCVIKVINW